MIVTVKGLKKFDTTNEICVEMQAKNEKGGIQASIFFYVSDEELKNYNIGDTFNLKLWRMGGEDDEKS